MTKYIRRRAVHWHCQRCKNGGIKPVRNWERMRATVIAWHDIMCLGCDGAADAIQITIL